MIFVPFSAFSIFSDRSGRSSHDDAPGSYHNRSFHETMTRASEKRSRSRSRSRSPIRGSGWGDNRKKGRSRSRSRSTEKFDQASSRDRPVGRSFHETMMQRRRSPPSFGNQHISSSWNSKSPDDGDRRENVKGSSDNDQPRRQSSPSKQDDNQWG